MSDELRLPDDLAACEARLAAQPLPASGIDRDQLMYRAGWAAAEAKLATINPSPSKGGARGGIRSAPSIAAWSLTSAAIAASLAVIVTLQWRPARTIEVAVNSTGLRPPLAATIDPPGGSQVQLAEAVSDSVRAGQIDVGFFGMRRQALKNIWGESTNAVAVAGDSEMPAAKTARELMEELLPAKSVRPAKIWPWENSILGGTI